jgi:arylsulfatase A-like enzyme
VNKLFGTILLWACLVTGCSNIPENDQTPTSIAETPIPHTTTIFTSVANGSASPARLADPRPNIIVILTDDQPYHTVEFMPTVRDVLMKEGVVFDNGFVTTPLCCPSRVSILTGLYVHNHGVYTNRMPLGGAPKYDDSDCFAIQLQEAGYRTAYYGKYLNDYEELSPLGYKPPGWDDWNAFLSNRITTAEDSGNAQYYADFSMSQNGEIIDYPEAEGKFSADVITQNGVDFISDSRDEPFLLFLSYYNPHSPYFWAPRHDDQFRVRGELQAEPYRPPNFMEADIGDKPQYLQDLNPIAVEKIDISYKQILRSLLSVDDGVASVLSSLENTGLKEKTVVVFLSDNGLTVGNHRLGLTKNCAYDECIRVPFIVYAPGQSTARSDSHLVANIDLAPTFIELAGAAPVEGMNGISLVPLFTDNISEWREGVLIEHWPTEEGVGSRIPEFYGIRTTEWKYVEYRTGETEFFDLTGDPFELNNLTNNSKYASLKGELKQQLDEQKTE